MEYECKKFSDIARCFQTLHKHIDDEISSVKIKQEEIEKKVDLIENQVLFANGEIKDLHDTHLPNLEEKMKTEANERLKLELWGRKWNLVIRGLSGKDREPPKETRTTVRIFFNQTLKLTVDEVHAILFTAVHRLPSGSEGKRNIIARFSSLIDRDAVLDLAVKRLRGTGISVVPDLPQTLASRRGNLLFELRQMPPEEKKRCRLVYLKEAPFLKLVMRDH